MDATTTSPQAVTGLMAMLGDAGHTVAITFLYLSGFAPNAAIITAGVWLSTECYFRLFSRVGNEPQSDSDRKREGVICSSSLLASNAVGFTALLTAIANMHDKLTDRITGEVKEGGYSAGQ